MHCLICIQNIQNIPCVTSALGRVAKTSLKSAAAAACPLWSLVVQLFPAYHCDQDRISYCDHHCAGSDRHLHYVSTVSASALSAAPHVPFSFLRSCNSQNSGLIYSLDIDSLDIDSADGSPRPALGPPGRGQGPAGSGLHGSTPRWDCSEKKFCWHSEGTSH
jgi:hypothetical protein